MSWILCGLLNGAVALADEGADISGVLLQVSHPKWDPKGKAIDPFARGDAKRKKEEWPEAIELLIASLERQPGCGKCMNSLSLALTGAERFEDASRAGETLALLFPDRSEGWLRVSTAWLEARELEKSLAATERVLLIELERQSIPMWSRRNRLLLELGRVDDANAILDGAKAAGMKDATEACLRIQLLAATDQPGAARDLWTQCATEEDIDLRRASEGWLAMAEGDHKLAATRLVLAGADDFARLTVAQLRLDQNEYEAALNLTTRLLEETGWAWDAHLARAQALHGLGRDDEALAALRQGPMAEGWEESHRYLTLDHVLLKPRGQEWPRTVAEKALALEITILAGKGDAAGARAMYDRAVAVHGERPALSAALTPGAPAE